MEIQAHETFVRSGIHAALADRRQTLSQNTGAGRGTGQVDGGKAEPALPSSRRAIIVERSARVRADAAIGYAGNLPAGAAVLARAQSATARPGPVGPVVSAPAQVGPPRSASAPAVPATGLVGSSVQSLDGRAIGTVSETRGFNNQMLQVTVATHGGLDETSRTIFLQMALRDIPGKTIRLNQDLATLSRLYGR